MYQFSTTDYEHLARELTEQITSKSLIQVNIAFENDDQSADIDLKAMIVPTYELETFPHGRFETLQNISPVWCETTTTTLDGVVANDFDFSTLKEYLFQW